MQVQLIQGTGVEREKETIDLVGIQSIFRLEAMILLRKVLD